MRDDRPQVLAQVDFLKHRDRLQKMDLEGRFSYIFEHNLWGSKESRSGIGSTPLETAVVRKEIPVTLRKIGASSILDVPCGDFRWMCHVDLRAVRYVGAYIVPGVVASNREKFSSPSQRFLQLDLTVDPLPTADLVLCRDCLVHLSYANIHGAIENVKRSGAKWILMTDFLQIETNTDIADGDWRPLNFTRPPFNFPIPHLTIVENCHEAGGAFDDSRLVCGELLTYRRPPMRLQFSCRC